MDNTTTYTTTVDVEVTGQENLGDNAGRLGVGTK